MNSDFKYWWFRIVASAILLMAGVMPVYCALVGKQEVQGALDILDTELQHSDLYMQRRALKIDSVSGEMKKYATYSPERLKLIMELGDCYSGYLTDSALVSYWHGCILPTLSATVTWLCDLSLSLSPICRLWGLSMKR